MDDATLVALIGARCYRSGAPEGADFPYVVINRISTDRPFVQSGSSGLVKVREQIDCYAETYPVVQSVADAVRGALDGWQEGTLGSGGNTCTADSIRLDGERDEYLEPEEGERIGIWVVQLDFVGFFRETVPTF
jgi:hypothetical protein